jgi:hypothetical protein
MHLIKQQSVMFMRIFFVQLRIAEAVDALVANWLPKAKADPKPKADDRRLIAALQQAALELDDDNIPLTGGRVHDSD